MRMKARKIALLGCLLAAALGLSACAPAASTLQPTAAPAGTQVTALVQATATAAPAAGIYQKITAQEAKQIMDSQPEGNQPKAVIVDVREPSEYEAGHIPNAILLPLGQIESKAAQTLPDKNATLLVYCRSGRRSKTGAETLLKMGYTNVLDMGGIIDWPYDVVTD